MTEVQEKQEELVRLGDEAELLLKAPVFNSTINQLVDASFHAFCNSKPDEKDSRERSYTHYRALVDIVNTLQQRVAIRDEINAKAGDNNQEDE